MTCTCDLDTISSCDYCALLDERDELRRELKAALARSCQCGDDLACQFIRERDAALSEVELLSKYAPHGEFQKEQQRNEVRLNKEISLLLQERDDLRRELEAARRVVEAAKAGIVDVHYSIENNAWPARADKTLTDLMNALAAYDAAKGE